MKDYTLRERASFYAKAFPNWPPPRVDDRWLDAMWVMGNNYSGSGYYGSYPVTYLRRIMSLFPDAERILHLFSGSLPTGTYTRFDIKPPADVVGEAHKLSSFFTPEEFDLILVDPPYSHEDALHYGFPMISRNTVLAQCITILAPRGFIVWLDQVLPMFRKADVQLCGLIGVVVSTNHRFRVASLFRKEKIISGGVLDEKMGD